MRLLDPVRRTATTDYHLVAAIPTPNGPMHLGHVGGPFLRMDILARFQRLCGNRTFLISGTDAYDSYVAVTAERVGVSPAEIASRYHREIGLDLASIDVIHDAFIDPLQPCWSSRYACWHHDLLDRLRKLGRVERRIERIPYSRSTGEYLLGGFIAGCCPGCGQPVVGSFCEECGTWFSPATIIDPRPTLDHHGGIEWREVSNLFLRLDQQSLQGLLADPGLPPGQRQVVKGYLAREGPYWRLTQQARWGVTVATTEVTAPSVFSTYGLGSLAYAALCGEEYGFLSGRFVNALAAGSGVIAVSAHGFDNILPELLGRLVLRMLHPELRTYDQLALNRFILLEGSKFSTSRRHAIWTREFARAVESDLVRYYLARISPCEMETNFRVDEFVALVNRKVVSGLQGRALASWERVDSVPVGTPEGRMVSRLDALLQLQQRALDPGRLRLAEVVRALDSWADGDAAESATESYWWLKGAAVLAWSLMPRWSLETWRSLGHRGEPSLLGFWHKPPLAQNEPRRRFERLDTGTVRLLGRGGAGHG